MRHNFVFTFIAIRYEHESYILLKFILIDKGQKISHGEIQAQILPIYSGRLSNRRLE